MSTSADPFVNGNGHHDHILRPRPINPFIKRTLSEEGIMIANVHGKDMSENGSTAQTRYLTPTYKETNSPANSFSGRSTPVPLDAPPSVKSIASARKQLKAEQRRRIFPTIDYASRVSHFDPNSDYRDFQGFYVLFWIALTIMAITTMLRNIKDTGYPMRVQIWQLFTVKVWELGVADGLMVASTSISLPLHKLFRSDTGEMLGLRWSTGGMALQSIYQTLWFGFWVL